MLFEEKAEEVYWLPLAVSLRIRAEVWRVEETGVRKPNDVVEETNEQKDVTITWLDANISGSQKSGLSLLHCSFCPIE